MIKPKICGSHVMVNPSISKPLSTVNIVDNNRVVVDEDISESSTNPVQNQAIYKALSEIVADLDLRIPKIYFGLTAYWNAERTLIGEQNAIYIYSDYQVVDGKNVAGIKVGDGVTYLIDSPFIDVLYYEHINDRTMHITDEEREFWNNKVTAFYSLQEEETLILTKENI